MKKAWTLLLILFFREKNKLWLILALQEKKKESRFETYGHTSGGTARSWNRANYARSLLYSFVASDGCSTNLEAHVKQNKKSRQQERDKYRKNKVIME